MPSSISGITPRAHGRAIARRAIQQKVLWSTQEKYLKIPNVDPNADFPTSTKNILTVIDLYDIPVNEQHKFIEGVHSQYPKVGNVAFIGYQGQNKDINLLDK